MLNNKSKTLFWACIYDKENDNQSLFLCDFLKCFIRIIIWTLVLFLINSALTFLVFDRI